MVLGCFTPVVQLRHRFLPASNTNRNFLSKDRAQPHPKHPFAPAKGAEKISTWDPHCSYKRPEGQEAAL
jgi:hypothetical protein